MTAACIPCWFWSSEEWCSVTSEHWKTPLLGTPLSIFWTCQEASQAVHRCDWITKIKTLCSCIPFPNIALVWNSFMTIYGNDNRQKHDSLCLVYRTVPNFPISSLSGSHLGVAVPDRYPLKSKKLKCGTAILFGFTPSAIAPGLGCSCYQSKNGPLGWLMIPLLIPWCSARVQTKQGETHFNVTNPTIKVQCWRIYTTHFSRYSGWCLFLVLPFWSVRIWNLIQQLSPTNEQKVGEGQ